jgi:hypothetical protein
VIPRFRPALSFADLALLGAAATAPVERMQEEFAARYGFAHAVWLPYGRVAVVCYLESLGAPGKAVLSPFNCVALGNGILRAGFTPLYVDAENGGFNQDVQRFSSALEDAQAGVVVPLWGLSSPLEQSGPHRRPVLYDFALRGLDPLKPQLGPQDGVLYSLGWGKPVNGLGGAMLCGDDGASAARWRRWQRENLRERPRRKPALAAAMRAVAFQPLVFGAAAYLFERWEVGSALLGHADREKLLPADWCSLPSAAQQRRMLLSLRSLDALRSERRAQVGAYQEGLRDAPGIALPPDEPHLSHFALRAADRDRIAQSMRRHGIFCSTRLFDRLLCDYPWLEGESADELRNARRLTRETLHLPLYHGLAPRTQRKVIAALAATLGEGAAARGRYANPH